LKGRRESRKLAVDALYEGEIRGRLPVATFEIQRAEGRVRPGSDDDAGATLDEASTEVVSYARGLVEGVQEHHAEIDALISRYTDRWAIDRMPVIDRTVIRIAIFELLWVEDVPVAVAINEAVELVKSLSTDDSGRFVNGLLGRIVETERASG
jgi:N utilization substance protein B